MSTTTCDVCERPARSPRRLPARDGEQTALCARCYALVSSVTLCSADLHEAGRQLARLGYGYWPSDRRALAQLWGHCGRLELLGAPLQAWMVAEILRGLVLDEEVM